MQESKGAAFIYGGTKFKLELAKASRYHRIINQFKNAGKAIEIRQENVDEYEKELERQCSKSGFNDKHIVALIVVSGCKLLCSKDANSYGFIKDSGFYPSGCTKPKIYSGKRNRKLLSKYNIVKIQNAC